MSEELREQIAAALTAPMVAWLGGPDSAYWLARADALLSGPLAPLLAAQAAVERVRELAEGFASDARTDPALCHDFGVAANAIRRALDSTP